jgi:hypothetical protein
MEHIYRNSRLKYPLSDKEYNDLDKVWKFLEEFKIGVYTLHKFRKKIIETINETYKVDEFFYFEKILDKMFWNLRSEVAQFVDTRNVASFDISDMEIVVDKLHDDNYYRSFINKIINIDDKGKKIYYKSIEGSIPFFNNDYFNLLTSFILLDRGLYERVMGEPNNVVSIMEHIELPKMYYEYDYPFPNLNMCCPLIGTDEFRIKKINKMYYDKDAENNWFQLIKPSAVGY